MRNLLFFWDPEKLAAILLGEQQVVKLGYRENTDLKVPPIALG
jgi:hypothetical protein